MHVGFWRHTADNFQGILFYGCRDVDCILHSEEHQLLRHIVPAVKGYDPVQARLEHLMGLEISHPAIVAVIIVLADAEPVSPGLCRNRGFIRGII